MWNPAVSVDSWGVCSYPYVKMSTYYLTNDPWGFQNQEVRLLRPAFSIRALALVCVFSALMEKCI